MVASHISTQDGNTACTSHKDWSKQSQSAQKTGMLQCGQLREHQDCRQKDMRAGSSWGLDQMELYQQISARCWAGKMRKMRLNVKEIRFIGQCQAKMAMGVERRQCLH